MNSLNPKVGLALAGGGPEGAIWEIGSLAALDEALIGADLHKLDCYVGVSAGAFVCALLANGISTRELVSFVDHSDGSDTPFKASTFFTPAVGQWLKDGVRLPGQLLQGAAEAIRFREEGSSWLLMDKLSRALPKALFDGTPLRRTLQSILSEPGRSDDFRALDTQLFVIATALNSGQPVRFGEDGYRHVPISLAVQASAALPGLYPAVEIDSTHYVDGVLQKTIHASVALDREVDLLLCLNPLVPLDINPQQDSRPLEREGLPWVLSQTFRALIHSRMQAGFNNYEPRFPGQQVLIFEPDRQDQRMFFTNIFRLSSRKEICEHAYQTMRKQLLTRYEKLSEHFTKLGLSLDFEGLKEDRQLFAPSHYTVQDRERLQKVPHELGSLLDRLDSKLG